MLTHWLEWRYTESSRTRPRKRRATLTTMVRVVSFVCKNKMINMNHSQEKNVRNHKKFQVMLSFLIFSYAQVLTQYGTKL